MKRTTLVRKTPLRQKRPINRAGRARARREGSDQGPDAEARQKAIAALQKRLAKARRAARKRWERDFGEHSGYVRGQGCQVCPARREVESHHEPLRSQGGTMPHQLGLCRPHHRERHRTSKEAFEAKHGVNLNDLTARLWAGSPHNPENKR